MRAFSRNGGVLATLDLVDHLETSEHFRTRVINYFGEYQTRPKSDVEVREPYVRGLGRLPLGLGRHLVSRQRNRMLEHGMRDADLIIMPDDWGVTFTAAFDIARRRNIPICCVVHIDLDNKFSAPGRRQPWTKEQTLACYRKADLIICVSGGIRERLARDLPDRADHIIAIQNGVDLARIDRLAAEPLPEGTALPDLPCFTALGRLVWQKGFDLLIEAHARLLAQGAERHAIAIIGEGPDRAALQAKATALGVADTVHFLGYVENPFPILARSAGLVTSSRFEGFPLSTTEGCALGIPVISTTCNYGPAEILDHGRYGALVPVEDPQALAAAMQDHLAHPETLRRKAAASFRDRQRLSAEYCHARYEAALAGIPLRNGRMRVEENAKLFPVVVPLPEPHVEGQP